jgi:hypothetical protein
MKYQTIIFYLIIPLAFFSLMSLLENVQAQTHSPVNHTTPSQQQQMNITAQALMETDIVGIKDTLAKAKIEIIQGNLKEALQDVRDVENELLLTEPSPTKLLSNIHKTITAIAKSNTYKALDTLTNVQVIILKAENQIFKVAFVNPQVMEQFVDIEKNTNEEDYSEEEEDNDDTMEHYNNMETNTNEEEYEE